MSTSHVSVPVVSWRAHDPFLRRSYPRFAITFIVGVAALIQDGTVADATGADLGIMRREAGPMFVQISKVGEISLAEGLPALDSSSVAASPGLPEHLASGAFNGAPRWSLSSMGQQELPVAGGRTDLQDGTSERRIAEGNALAVGSTVSRNSKVEQDDALMGPQSAGQDGVFGQESSGVGSNVAWHTDVAKEVASADTPAGTRVAVADSMNRPRTGPDDAVDGVTVVTAGPTKRTEASIHLPAMPNAQLSIMDSPGSQVALGIAAEGKVASVKLGEHIGGKASHERKEGVGGGSFSEAPTEVDNDEKPIVIPPELSDVAKGDRKPTDTIVIEPTESPQKGGTKPSQHTPKVFIPVKEAKTLQETHPVAFSPAEIAKSAEEAVKDMTEKRTSAEPSKNSKLTTAVTTTLPADVASSTTPAPLAKGPMIGLVVFLVLLVFGGLALVAVFLKPVGKGTDVSHGGDVAHDVGGVEGRTGEGGADIPTEEVKPAELGNRDANESIEEKSNEEAASIESIEKKT